MPSNYYQLAQSGSTADIDIYGDIRGDSWWGEESDMGVYKLSQRLSELTDVDTINVNINSYGGEVAEGLAIYNALKRHSAKVVTHVDGFACSIASVVFMAGDERIMGEASLLMIHNAWTSVFGANAEELRKQADDLDVITSASKAAYLAHVNIDEAKLSELMDAESWITPGEALDMGFASSIYDAKESDRASQDARKALFQRVLDARPVGPPAAQSTPPEPQEPLQQAAKEPEPKMEPEPTERSAKQKLADFFMSQNTKED